MLWHAWRGRAAPAAEINAAELEQIVELLLASGAAALAWWRVRDTPLRDTPAAARLHSAYRLHCLRALIHQDQTAALVQKFHARGLDPILMKGWSLARLYPELGLRPYSDVDLIVAPAAMPVALSVAAESAGIAVDLAHDEITRFNHCAWNDIYRRSSLLTIGEVEVRVLGGEDHLRALCIHFLKHGGWGPLWLCDIALLVESRPTNFDWELCMGAHRRHRSWISCVLVLAHLLLGMDLEGVPIHFEPDQLLPWILPTVTERWGGMPRFYRSDFLSYLRHPLKIAEAIADRWPPDPIVSTLNSGVPFGAWPAPVLQMIEILWRAKSFLLRTPRTAPGTNAI